MEKLFLLIPITILLLLLMQFVGWLQNSHYYKCYRDTYESLSSKKFYRNGSQVYDFQYRNDENGFVYFLDSGSFRLNKIVWMHSDTIGVDFYHWYWRKKMIKWFEENVNIDELQEYEYSIPLTRGGKFRFPEPLIEEK